jgi:hypothetical protein
MAENEVVPAQAEGEIAPQRHVSGLLMVSLLLSIGGLLVIPIIGGIGALILAVFGRKRAMRDPLVIGPKFALFCIAIAAISLPLQMWRVYYTLPQIGYLESMSAIRTDFYANVENRDWQAVYDGLHPDYRKAYSVADVERILAAAFPGQDEIKFTEENLTFHQPEGEEEKKAEAERFATFLGGEGKTFDFDLTCTIVFPEQDQQVDMSMSVRVERLGYMKFDAAVLDFDATRGPLIVEEEPTGDVGSSKGGDKPEEDAPPDDGE